jgi:hypothetical protein
MLLLFQRKATEIKVDIFQISCLMMFFLHNMPANYWQCLFLTLFYTVGLVLAVLHTNDGPSLSPQPYGFSYDF